MSVAARSTSVTDLPAVLEGATVRVGRVACAVRSPLVEHGALPGTVLVANRDQAFLHVPGVASFSVRAGSEVMVHPGADATLGEVEAFLYGTVTALVLGQQRRFALHATTVSVAGATVAIAGRRGAGKTSTALALNQRGHELLGDDVLILEPVANQVRAITTGRPLHVSDDAAEALRLDVSSAVSLGPRIEKLALPQPRRSPSRLEAIVVLVTRPVDAVRFRSVTGRAGFAAVHANAYRPWMVRALWQPQLFDWAARVAANVPVSVVARPHDRSTYGAVAQSLERMTSAGAIELQGGKTD